MTEKYGGELQCPTCGRIRADWNSSSTKHLTSVGNKAKQREDREDRTADYRLWRWGFGGGCFVSDIDQVEWRIVTNGYKSSVQCVAVLELTRIDGDVPIPPQYLRSILNRFLKRDGQAGSIVLWASLLKVDAYVIAYRHSLDEFWIYNLSKEQGWWKKNKAFYEGWIRSLPSIPKGMIERRMFLVGA